MGDTIFFSRFEKKWWLSLDGISNQLYIITYNAFAAYVWKCNEKYLRMRKKIAPSKPVNIPPLFLPLVFYKMKLFSWKVKVYVNNYHAHTSHKHSHKASQTLFRFFTVEIIKIT